LLDKLDELKEVEYNDEEHFAVQGTAAPSPYDANDNEGDTFTLSGNTYHSISILVESGIASVEIKGYKVFHKKGYSRFYEATELYLNDIIVKAESDDAVINITTVK
jgi:hypothetical protein